MTKRWMSKRVAWAGAFALLLGVVLLPPNTARAQPLRVALSGPVTTIDPHFYSTAPNNLVAGHIFDRLMHRAPDGRLIPGLATSWRSLSPTMWELQLRPGVTWHDGVAFTAQDVAFTIERAQHVPNNLGGFENLLRPIIKVEITAPLTLHLSTASPVPTLPSDLSFIAIVSEHVGKNATTADYNSGKAAIGTGPYKLVTYTQGDRVVLVRNEAWWGQKPEWDRVTLSIVINIAARTASLLAGDVDMIESPSAADMPRLREDKQVGIFAVPGTRVAYINPIYTPAADAPPVTDKAGTPLAATPFGVLKVRQALSLAINRAAIAERILLGTGVPTGQWLPPGSYSYAPDIGVPEFDPVRAKALLAEAGFPDGFKMALSLSNDRTPYAVEIAQAIAQMWTRIGVVTSVDAMPFAVYSARGSRQQFTAYFGSLTNPSLEAGLLLRNLLMTVNATTGDGTYNWGRYSNPALDALVRRARATVDDAAREKLLMEGIRLVSADVAFIPVYQFRNIWATRGNIVYDPRVDELTYAIDVHRAAAK